MPCRHNVRLRVEIADLRHVAGLVFGLVLAISPENDDSRPQSVNWTRSAKWKKPLDGAKSSTSRKSLAEGIRPSSGRLFMQDHLDGKATQRGCLTTYLVPPAQTRCLLIPKQTTPAFPSGTAPLMTKVHFLGDQMPVSCDKDRDYLAKSRCFDTNPATTPRSCFIVSGNVTTWR
mgnify:CR=1 FL=1